MNALDLFEECAELFEELGDDHYVLLSIFHVAWMAEDLGDRGRALALHEQNLARARSVGNKRIEAVTLYNIARFARLDGRIQEALAMTLDVYRLFRDFDEPVETSDSISRIASMLAHAGMAELAIRLLSCSEALRQEIGVRRSWVVERNEETLKLARRELDEAAFAAAWQQGKDLSPDEAVELARAAAVEA